MRVTRSRRQSAHKIILLAQDMSVSDVPVHELCREECCIAPNALSSHILSADEEKGGERA